jgi:hypothetical protein
MKKQTAVEWMYKELNNCLHREQVSDMIDELREQLLAMEKEQLENAYFNGGADNMNDEGSFKEYYNETYGGDK